MASVGSLVVSLAADIGLFEGDMKRAANVAAREAGQIARVTGGIGRTINDIGRAIGTLPIAGFDALGSGARAATAAVRGLGSAVALIGVASWPVAAITAAAGALAYWVSTSNEAEESTKKLRERIDELRKSKQELALQPLVKDRDEVSKQIMETEQRIAQLERQIELGKEHAAGISDVGKQAGQAGVIMVGVTENEKKLVAEREKLIALQRDVLTVEGEIGKQRGEQQEKETAPLEKYLQTLQEQVATFEGGAVAAAQFALSQGALGEAMAKAGPDAERLKDAILEYAAALDKLNESKRVEAERQAELDRMRADNLEFYKRADAEMEAEDRRVQQLGDSITSYLNPALAAYTDKLKEVDEALKLNAISEEQAGAARRKAGEDYARSGQRSNEFAQQAARNIQGITASLLKGEMSGRSFGASVVNALKDIAAELAAQALLRALFGSFAGSGGLLGSFATAVLGKKAAGGPVEAGKPYLVGERGPEVIVPGQAGNVIPNHALGGGITVVNNLNLAGATPSMLPAVAMLIEASERRTKQAVRTYMARGFMP